MTEGRHHRRRDDDHTADGIYFPPPREVPRPRSSPPEPPVPPVPLSPWAPGPGTAGPAKPPEEHPPTAPVYYARASDWTVRPSPWAAADQDEFDGEFDGFDRDAPPSPVPPAQPSPAPQPSPMVQPLPVVQPSQVVQPEPDPPGAFPPPGALTRAAAPEDEAAHEWLPPLYPQEWPPSTGPTEEWSPLQSLQERRALELPGEFRGELEPAGLPAQVVPLPKKAPQPPRRASSATAWWIAVGVIIVALGIAAGILVGLSLAQRS